MQVNFLIREIYFGLRNLMSLTMNSCYEPHYKISFLIQFALPSFLPSFLPSVRPSLFYGGESAVFFIS